MANGLDLGSILQSIGQYAQAVASDRNIAAETLQAQQQLRQQGVAAVREVGQLDQEVQAMDATQALEMERRKKATAEAFGVDILDPNNRIAYLAREQQAAQDEALARSKRASELIDMNILDSPLEYLVERPFADRHQAAAAQATQRAQLLDKAITDINQQAQATVKTQAAINQELTADEVAKRAQLTKLKADEAVRIAQMNSNQAYLNDLKTLRSFDEETLRYATEAYKLKRHEDEFRMKQEEVRAARELRAKQKQSAEEELQYLYDKYNLGADMTGRARAVSIADFQAMLKVNKKAVVELAELGEKVWIDPTNPSPQTASAQLASTPGESMVILSKVQGSLPKSAEKVSSMFQNELQNAHTELKKTTSGKITLDDLSGQINGTLQGKVEGKQKVVGKVDVMLGNAESENGMYKNIYRAPDVNVMAQMNPSLAQNPAWKFIVEPATIADGPSPKADAFIKQAEVAIREKKLSVEQAAGFISGYFSAAMQTNSINERYSLVGLPEYKKPGEVKAKYNAPISTPSLVGATKQIRDVSDQKVVEHLLLRNVVDLKKLSEVWKGY